VLPAISQILRKFLSPLGKDKSTSSLIAQGNDDSQKIQSDEKPFQKLSIQPPLNDEEKKEQLQDEESSSFNGNTQRPKLKLIKSSAEKTTLTSNPGILEILNQAKIQRELFLRWIGVKSYKTLAREQKKTTYFAKGTILDRKAE
jgi:hypothetical protein